MAVFIGVLGPVVVEVDGVTPPLRRPQVRQVLALLATAGGRPVSVDVLEDDLWPESSPRSPRGALHVIVNRARVALGPTGRDVLVSTGDGYRLDTDECDIDLALWEQEITAAQHRVRLGDADGALALHEAARRRWRGDPLGDVEGSFRLDQERRRLEVARTDAEVAELDLLVAASRFVPAGGLASALLERDHLREDVAVTAICALDGANRRAEALRAAARFRGRLRDELGLTPSPQFDAMELQVLAGGAVTVPDVPTTRPLRRVRPGGREAEHRLVDTEIERSLGSPSGGVVVVTGEPGIGVSTFLREVADRWDDGSGRPVRWAASGRSRIHSLRGAVGIGAPRLAEGQRGEHLRAREALADAANEHGLVLVVDDAHELDEWSVSLLRSLATAPPARVVVLLGLPADPASTDSPALLEALAATSVVVRLEPLDEEAVRDLVRERWPDLPPAAVQRWAGHLHRWCGGNPMWTHEVLEDAHPLTEPTDLEIVPLSAEASARRRLSQLPPQSRDLLRLAAVLGPEVDLEVVAAVAGQPVESVVPALSRTVLVDALVQGERPGRWRFRHQLVQRAIVDSVGPGEAATWHAAAGRYLRDVAGRRSDAARHLVRGVPLVSAADAYAAARSAGGELRAAGAYAEAADLYREAAELAPQPEERYRAWLDEAEAAEQMGDRARAARRYDEVISACAEGGSPDLLAEAALGATSHASAIGGQGERRSRLRMVWRRLDPDHPRFDSVAAELALELMNARQELDPELAEHVRRIASDPASPAHLLARRYCLADAEIDLCSTAEEAAGLTSSAVRSGAPPFVVSACLAVGIGVGLSTGAWDRAEEWIDEMTLLGATSGEPRARWQSLAFRAVLLEGRGDSVDADRAADEALVLGERLDMADATATFSLHQLGRAYRSGSLAVLAPVLAAADERYRFAIWSTLRGLAELDAGDTATASRLLREALPAGLQERYHFRAATIGTGALLAARLGDTGTLALLEPHLDAAADRFVMLGYGGPCLGPVDWYRAEAARALGRTDAADELLAAAVERCRTAGGRAWLEVLERVRPVNPPR